MNGLLNNIQNFVDYVRTLKGDEKGEAQVFCDRLFQAFGHQGYKEAGAELEYRVKAKGKTTKFADLLWRPRLLLEMKKRGENLEKHYQQAFEYWLELVPHRPKYVVLCNFDEFWIYDLDLQLREPVDRVSLEELPNRFTALNFLFPENRQPLFNNNKIDVTRTAADKVAQVFNRLVQRGEKVETAQRFILQCVVALFAEDIDLLPRGLFTEFLGDCQMNRVSSYDLIGGLFRQMGSDRPAPKDSRYGDVPYFNGGIFSTIEPIHLTRGEIDLLLDASAERWSKVEPAIFGALFESSMGKEERHALGAHYTSEADIQKVVLPTIIRPWRERIEAANTLKDLLALRQELINFKILDPACGSGNFLYVAYRELKRLEAQLLTKIHQSFSRAANVIGTMSLVKTSQFYGIDIKPFAVELAKVTLMLAKKLALDEENHLLNVVQMNLALDMDRALPLDNLDKNIRCDDALFCDWETVDVVVGNPPFLGGHRLRLTLNDEYVDRIFAKFPEVEGQVDICTYWFRLTHNHLGENCRAGLVGTNTISQGQSRKAALDYITQNGGYIYDVISTQPWSGEAKVHISIINWLKTSETKELTYRIDHKVVSNINSSLKAEVDVTQAKCLQANRNYCFKGVQPSGKGFLVTEMQVKQWIKANSKNQEVLKLFIQGQDLAQNVNGKPDRWIIDFNEMSLEDASEYKLPFNHVKNYVKPERDQNRRETTKLNWWKYGEKRPGMRKALATLPFYFVVPRVSKWSIFILAIPDWLPGDGTNIVASDDFYVLGILTSNLHRQWVKAQSSTLKADTRYTHNTCFETFPFPQNCSEKIKTEIRAAMQAIHDYRTEQMERKQWGITQLYNQFFNEPTSQLAKLHAQLDQLVCKAYGIKSNDDPLKFLLELNFEVANRESQGLSVVAPG
ncbi:class I SAM-dependent DNA methyltransferase [Argonema galeatum]|uniref:class I SAM-dependent DNA methyltransferase n=1 Tax=Argonema galeatum TaxID=2942762 RepID=UPI002011E8FC|nr:DNA methyltransferase [Argonema galeatum]MCL1462915.1 N-6 DNA methylase [Argonema galeatum A003/A1]